MELAQKRASDLQQGTPQLNTVHTSTASQRVKSTPACCSNALRVIAVEDSTNMRTVVLNRKNSTYVVRWAT